MTITLPTFYPADRAEWRKWLQKNHASETCVWLIYPHADTGKPKIPYAEAVQEALCFGWIDSTLAKHDEHSARQRWTPRKAKSNWSELNKHHARLMIAKGLMTPAGAALLPELDPDKFIIPPELLKRLKAHKELYKKMQTLPRYYLHIRLDGIIRRMDRPDFYEKMLADFTAKTLAGKRFGPFKDNPEIY